MINLEVQDKISVTSIMFVNVPYFWQTIPRETSRDETGAHAAETPVAIISESSPRPSSITYLIRMPSTRHPDPVLVEPGSVSDATVSELHSFAYTGTCFSVF